MAVVAEPDFGILKLVRDLGGVPLNLCVNQQ